MEERAVHIRLLVVAMLSAMAAGLWLFLLLPAAYTSPYLQVYFLDVGQGDAIFIQTPDGVQVLIDGGPDARVLEELSTVMPLFDKSIDMVVGTHPDKDHIAGLIDVLGRYSVATVLRTENSSDTRVFEAYQKAVAQEGADVVYARAGQVFVLGASTTLSVLYPVSDASQMESNASSIVLQLRYGNSTVLLTGDAPKRIEKYLTLTQGEDLQSQVVKIGHHGSRTSSDKSFLDMVDPTYAVISAGKNNRYGHPHAEVVDLLSSRRVFTYNTAEVARVEFVSDGTSIWRE